MAKGRDGRIREKLKSWESLFLTLPWGVRTIFLNRHRAKQIEMLRDERERLKRSADRRIAQIDRHIRSLENRILRGSRYE